MNAALTDRPAPPDPDEVVRTIAYVSSQVDVAYAEALADNIMAPDPVETAAFRAPELAQRSLIATRYLLDNVNSQIRRREDESNKAWLLRAERYRTKVGQERRLLETIVAGLRAQRGIEAAPPNPRGRAFRRLAKEYPVRFLQLVREEEDALAEKRRAAKADRKQAARDRRRTGPA